MKRNATLISLLMRAGDWPLTAAEGDLTETCFVELSLAEQMPTRTDRRRDDVDHACSTNRKTVTWPNHVIQINPRCVCVRVERWPYDHHCPQIKQAPQDAELCPDTTSRRAHIYTAGLTCSVALTHEMPSYLLRCKVLQRFTRVTES